MRKIILGLMLAATALAAATGCKKTLDVNTNPNALQDVTGKQLLSSAEVSLAQAYGNYFQIVGGIWGQYWTQNPLSSQYRPLEQYSPGPSTANNAWSLLYAGVLPDLEALIDKKLSANYTAVAMMLKAYTFQLLTDNFGDIPYSEALRGDEGITSPKFDAQQAVYEGIIQMTSQAVAMIDIDAQGPENDVIFGGDMEAWEAFGNTLLLRMHLRLSNVNPGKAQQGIAALESAGAAFLDAGSTAEVTYFSGAGNNNPLYAEIRGLNGVQNLIASATTIDSFIARNDPRIGRFYTTATGGAYRGNRQGQYDTSTTIAWSYPSAAVGGLAAPAAGAATAAAQTAPVKLLSSYESLFLQAEAQARGWMAGNAEATLKDAVRTNMQEWGVTSTAAINRYVDTTLQYPVSGSVDDMVRTIITEKYYAMCGNQNIESWTEWRRTGYPTFFQKSANAGSAPSLPARLPYPETELTRNLNFPGQKTVFDRVYWDVN